MPTWRKKGDGYEIRWYRPDGSRASRTFHGTWSQAVAQGHIWEQGDGGRTRGAPKTMGDALTAWTKRPGRRPLTQQAVESRVRNNEMPRLGHLPIERVTKAVLEGFLAELGERLSPGFIHNIRWDISAALDLAVESGAIKENPAKRLRMAEAPEKVEIVPPSAADIVAFLRYADGLDNPIEREVGLAVRLAVATGARIGEVCALQWGDIDFPSCTIAIVRAAIAPIGKGVKIQPTKTKVRRRVAIPPSLADRLSAARVLKTPAGCAEDDDFVLCTSLCKPLNPGTFSSRFERVRNGTGLHFRFHDLRHFTASAWLADMDAFSASRAIGHTRQSTTTDTYGHPEPDIDRRTAEAIARRIDL